MQILQYYYCTTFENFMVSLEILVKTNHLFLGVQTKWSIEIGLEEETTSSRADIGKQGLQKKEATQTVFLCFVGPTESGYKRANDDTKLNYVPQKLAKQSKFWNLALHSGI